MNQKKRNLFFIVSSLLIVAFCAYQYVQKNGIQAVEDTNNPESFIAEIDKGNGQLLQGEQFDPDKPVIRPTYQGDFNTIFDDVIGPTGEKFKGFFDPKNAVRSTQQFRNGDSLIYGNVGTYNERPLALKIDFLGGHNWQATVGIFPDGALRIAVGEDKPMYYQLVYNEPSYPPVEDVYLELPNKINVGQTNATSNAWPYITIASSNLKKTYLTIPSEWNSNWGGMEFNPMKRSYSLASSAQFPDSELFKIGLDSTKEELPIPELSVVSDNNQKTFLQAFFMVSTDTNSTIFSSDMKAPFTPYYLPLRGNGVENSDTFEAKYDVGQGLTDTYEDYLPDSLKLVVEDEKGYFKNLNHDPIEFTDKLRNPINLDITTEFLDKKIEVTIPKATLKELKSNQVNMKLNFGTTNLNVDKVLENYDAEKDYYKVPLTFYNIRTRAGEEKVSEKTEVDATINQGLYGDPVETSVFVGSKSEDLDVNKLIKNSASTIPGDVVTLEMLQQKEFTEEGLVELPVKLQSTKNSALTKIVNVPINVTKGDLVMPEFFENQNWLIDALNSQLGKKIGVNMYQSDLQKVTQIGVTDGNYDGEHIPATINALKNLVVITAIDVGLVGEIPKEIGELSELYYLDFTDNNLTGKLPTSLGNLTNMIYLYLGNNKLSGTIPKEFTNMTNLGYFKVPGNPLVGQLPNFSQVFSGIDIENTQLTYNSTTVPPFTSPIEDEQYWGRYKYSFVASEKATLQLLGNKIVSSRTETIKPFDPADPGYFDLAVKKPGPEGMEETSTKEKLYPDHHYTIKDKQSGEVLYEGFGEEAATVLYRSNIEYQVTVDEAFDNPANNVTIQGKIPELKFSETPQRIKLTTQVNNDSVDNSLALDGTLAIFDNRGDENRWKLKITPSRLVDNQKQLQGEYSYTNLAGDEKIIIDNQAMLIEQGASGTEEIISISEQWKNGKGLKYRLKPGNLLGNYEGSVIWSLEDAP